MYKVYDHAMSIEKRRQLISAKMLNTSKNTLRLKPCKLVCGVEHNPSNESKHATGQDEPKRAKMEVEVIKAQKEKNTSYAP